MPSNKPPLVPRHLLLPFVLVTFCFALWGFANDITNPMVAAFKTVLEMSNARAALVQLAFYGGYFTMAIPASLFIKRYSYKAGLLLGLGLYAVGALLFYPAASHQAFVFFLLALYIMTFGLAFLETTANPLVLSMGPPETATRRLNLAQAFNPLGSLAGMFVASQFILGDLWSERRDATGALVFPLLGQAEKAAVRGHDLLVIRDPYVVLGLFVLLYLFVLLVLRLPSRADDDKKIDIMAVTRRLLGNRFYISGVVAQMFYVGAQIMCWTFIIQYAENLGLDKATGQRYNMVAMLIFYSAVLLAPGCCASWRHPSSC